MTREELIRNIEEKLNTLDEVVSNKEVMSAYDVERIVQREVDNFNDWLKFFNDLLADPALDGKIRILSVLGEKSDDETTSLSLFLSYYGSKFYRVKLVKGKTIDKTSVHVEVNDSIYWKWSNFEERFVFVDCKVSRKMVKVIVREVEELYERCKDLFDQAFTKFDYVASLCKKNQAIEMPDFIFERDALSYVINLEPDNRNESFMFYDPNEDNENLLSMSVAEALKELNRRKLITSKMPVVVSELPEIYQEVIRKYFDGIEYSAESALTLRK